jgi:hypothetical protein
MTINKQELILQLKDFLGDVNLPDDQTIDYAMKPESLEIGLYEALGYEGLGNQLDIEYIGGRNDDWITTYYASFGKNVVLNYDNPTVFHTIEDLADWIIETNEEADKLEAKLKSNK